MRVLQNEKGIIHDLDHRASMTKVRGGWNENKIKKELKHKKSDSSEISFYREIAKFDNPDDFGENLFYHGSGNSISILKPSIVLGDTSHYGGGYGEKYYAVSLSKDKNIASNFTGQSRFGNVAPVIVKRGAVIKRMPEISDSEELTEIISELWDEGIDAVIIGDHSKPHSEQEIAVLNPKCLAVGPSEGFQVFQKPKMPSMTKDEIEDLWKKSSHLYELKSLESWERRNQQMIDKTGEGLNPENKLNSKQKGVIGFHQHNLEEFEKQELKNKRKNKRKI